MATHPVSRDIYIDKGADFSQVIELSVPFADYDFTGSIKSSYTATTSVPIAFAAVTNEPNKMEISVTAENTILLRRLRGVYDIFGTDKTTGEVHKEREGQAHYSQAATIEVAPLPPSPILALPPFDAGTITDDVILLGLVNGAKQKFTLTGTDFTSHTLYVPADGVEGAELTAYITVADSNRELVLHTDIVQSSEAPGVFPAELDINATYILKMYHNGVAWFLTSFTGGYTVNG